MIGAEADAKFPQCGAGILGKALYVVGNTDTIENTEGFGDVERKAARNSLKSLAIFQIGERPEELLHMLRKPEIEPPLHHIKRLAGQLFVRKNRHARLEHMRTRSDLADGLAEPADDSVIGEDESFVDGFAHPSRASFDLAR